MGEITARFNGTCASCGGDVPKGSKAYWDPGEHKIICISCGHMGRVATDESLARPIAGKTPQAVLAQAASMAEKLEATLRTAEREAELLKLALKQLQG